MLKPTLLIILNPEGQHPGGRGWSRSELGRHGAGAKSQRETASQPPPGKVCQIMRGYKIGVRRMELRDQETPTRKL